MAVKGSHGNGSRGRSYGLLLILAFGAAIFGVMILHKLRERRIFNLLVQEKDHQLISLQLLLQKEKDNVKDAKKQMEEMKAKMHKLRTKKLDLETRILEMESTISSLREEQRTIASSLEEKQKENKMLMDYKRGENHQENARFKALSRELRKKEAEIEELKQQRVKVWSVGRDDPSNLQINSTTIATRATTEGDAETRFIENVKSKKGEISARTEDKMQDGKNETIEEQHSKHEDSQEVSSKGHDEGKTGNENNNEVGTNVGEQTRNIVNADIVGNDVKKIGKRYSPESIGRRTRVKRRRISVMNRGGSETSLRSEKESVESMRSRKAFTESMGSEMEKRAENAPVISTFLEDIKFLNKTENEKSEENGQQEKGTNNLGENKDGEDHEASRITEKDVKDSGLAVEDDQETEAEALTSRNSIASAEEDDEPEF